MFLNLIAFIAAIDPSHIPNLEDDKNYFAFSISAEFPIQSSPSKSAGRVLSSTIINKLFTLNNLYSNPIIVLYIYKRVASKPGANGS